MKPEDGLLQRSGIHMTQEDNDKIKKNNDIIRTLLDSISTNSTENLNGITIDTKTHY